MGRLDQCKGCYGYCCTSPPGGLTYVTESDVKRISKYLDISAEEFKKRYLNRLPPNYMMGYTLLSRGHEYPKYTFKDTGLMNFSCCYFHQYGRCSIYPVRPVYCKDSDPVPDCQKIHKMKIGLLKHI